ncbi:helix-turn-helix domain-containing protein [Micromonospora sp. RP3T]|uniref:helix-turn-helix domain-containing protein n=1 Tax=Micromonospora sp. RP3T TaxID=2135446 RepID=UPI000D1593E3|nr:helix-turn-helix domain-containing protein [Micromonospora sp. RP3T]PTA43029.1 excisionase [Micromonospora sp. RP3T]
MTIASHPRAVAPRSVRPAEAAALLGVCRDTVYVLMRSGRLRSIKAGRARLIPLTAIDDFLSADEEFAA